MSQSAEDLLRSQTELHGRIARLMENMRKLGAANITIGTVQARIVTLDRYWSKFEDQHETLSALCETDASAKDYVTTNLVDLTEETYLNTHSQLLDYAKELTAEPAGTAPAPQHHTSSRATPPRIQIPAFSGVYEEWPHYRDLFTSIIRNETQLSGVEKLHYLKASLKGEAETLVRDIPTTAANFQRAWDTLYSFYENKRLLVRACLARFTSLPKMKTESAMELRKIFHGITSTVSTLEGIGRPIATTADLFVFTVTELFDHRTRREWENSINETSEPPTYDVLKRFVETRMHTLEALNPGKPEGSTSPSKPQANSNRVSRTHCTQKQPNKPSGCILCKGNHFVMFCSDYKNKTPVQRLEALEKLGTCINCLGRHTTAACGSQKSCTKCAEKHHTTLHDAIHKPPEAEASASTHITHGKTTHVATVLLTTARVLVKDHRGNQHPIRILIDQGSEVSLITERLTQRLGLPRKQSSMTVLGIGGMKLGKAKGQVTLAISDSRNRTCLQANALIVLEITQYPSRKIHHHKPWAHLEALELADPNYTSHDPVDALLGADAYHSIIEPGLRKGDKLEPVAQRTVCGWILSGLSGTGDTAAASAHSVTVEDSLSTFVRQFWEQEDDPKPRKAISEEDRQCEDLFIKQHSREERGRYMVRLPVKGELPDLSKSRKGALAALIRTENQFRSKPNFRQLYTDFMKTYEDLGYMTRMAKTLETPSRVAYLPHHGVWKESSITTKLRVVFNGSWCLPSGTTLNNHLMAEENLLPALPDILMRWRRHTYVVAADIEKMYRQILVHPDDRDLQRILWRYDESADVEEYQLNTVTYGLTCAPFLALRTLKRHALNEQSNYPSGSAAILHDVYVDDVLTGANNIEQLKVKTRELNQLCMAGGFPLKKWTSNSLEVIKDIPKSDRADQDELVWETSETSHATLGLRWSPKNDVFSYTVKPSLRQTVTKRTLLAEAAQLFDPLGWLTPVTVKAKIAIQATWLFNLQWDDPLPERAAEEWAAFHSEWPHLTSLRIKRSLEDAETIDHREIHGYADASERAYAAVVYLRTTSSTGDVATRLLAAKSKVAPLKQISLPRLELCGAQLLANLTRHVTDTLGYDNLALHLWSDSTVTLGWIQGHPARWKTYVANRVSEIQRIVPGAHWHHIPGTNNPADCASRGLTPTELIHHELWWNGPSALLTSDPTQTTSQEAIELEDLPEARTVTTNVTTVEEPMIEDFSDYNRLLRVTAWCQRWLGLTNHQGTRGPLSKDELLHAEITWIRVIQTAHYSLEIKTLTSRSEVQANSSIKRLTPFLDPSGIIRVGGRLKLSTLTYNEKHPIILPPASHLTRLLVQAAHRKMLHGGVQLTLASLRQQFWIPQGRRLVKSCIKQCVHCTRWRAAPTQQIMANLPRARVTPSRPFQFTGVDYAGPIHLKTSPGRGQKSRKGFIVVFVCLSTRAVHLDTASDYTTEAFLAAFRRFISRRGLCSELWSDQGTNFVGADKELQRLFSATSRDGQEIAERVANERVRWRFNPPAAPHCGGIWEAAVKSVKHHLQRVIGETMLTFEAMTTLLAQVEACLNSRPMSAMSDDPEDISALTPSHLLIGSCLTALPEPSLINTQHLSHWQHITKMRDDFWARWSKEYLQTLNQRHKWLKTSHEFHVGRLCILKSDIAPPSRWALGRIKAIYPGEDGLIRTIRVKTSTTELTRPITKIVLLPLAANEEV